MTSQREKLDLVGCVINQSIYGYPPAPNNNSLCKHLER